MGGNNSHAAFAFGPEVLPNDFVQVLPLQSGKFAYRTNPVQPFGVAGTAGDGGQPEMVVLQLPLESLVFGLSHLRKGLL